MKLSEAIRLGAMLKPQGFGSRAARIGAESTCALGAAADAVGILAADDAQTYQNIIDTFPYSRDITVYSPDCAIESARDSLYSMCWRLNDGGWTRERIADWVATIEAQQEVHPMEVIGAL